MKSKSKKVRKKARYSEKGTQIDYTYCLGMSHQTELNDQKFTF